MSSESSPLLSYRLSSVTEEGDGLGGGPPELAPLVGGGQGTSGPPAPDPARQLSTFFGVVVPTVLSMFSIVVFMRVGFVVGHAGLLQALLMLVVAYVILMLTVLSVCAICTNGAIQGGGAYFMISRTLGPELGGGIGLMFYLANVCACGVYILGLVEAVLDVFGAESSGRAGTWALPQGYLYSLLYGSLVLLVCLLVCLVGAPLYARAAGLIFLLVNLALGAVVLSFFLVPPQIVSVTHGANRTLNASFTGLRLDTLRANLPPMYSRDYTTNNEMTFATVFAILFNGCTGIMAGSNMSGELRNPSSSIPKGTIMAVAYTFVIYLLLFFLTSFTCERALLKEDYGFFRSIDLWPPLVLAGVYAASLSASMSSLIGASRILQALAKDDLFGVVLAPAKIVSEGGNPWVAVLCTWALVQLVLFAGKLNTMAGFVTIFYLVAYAAVDLACLALEWASAPNFRPTFQLFSWHTCLLGISGCLVMMVLISPAGASGSLVLLLALLGVIHLRAPASSWGYISQALLFHQVRKYLLLLDVRKEHVKFWRPQMLLLVSNPRSAAQLVRFVNDLKKGGLFVLGHVEIGELDMLPSDPIQAHYTFWLSLVDKLNVKAFVDLTLSPSVRQGTQHLLRITGLGGMKPNTLVLGFYDSCVPPDCFLLDPAFLQAGAAEPSGVAPAGLGAHFPPVRGAGVPKALSAAEYVAILADAVKMQKNLCLARYFPQLERERLVACRAAGWFVDVWPLNLLHPEVPAAVDVCSLFLLQLACILTMVSSWRAARLRLFLPLRAAERGRAAEEKLQQLLQKLRIRATIQAVAWEPGRPGGEGSAGAPPVPDEDLAALNALLLAPGGQVAVRFLYLPRPPADAALYERYLAQLELLTRGLGPTLLVHGLTPVTCTEL